MSEQRQPWWGDKVLHEFTIPKGLQEEGGAKTVGMIVVEWDDELRASKIAAGNFTALAGMLVRFSVATIDGKVVDQDGEEVQLLFHESSKVRKLLQAGRAKLHDPTDEEEAAFLGSLTRKV